MDHRYVLKPGLNALFLPGVGRVSPGQVLEGEQYARFVPNFLALAPGTAAEAIPDPKLATVTPITPAVVPSPRVEPPVPPVAPVPTTPVVVEPVVAVAPVVVTPPEPKIESLEVALPAEPPAEPAKPITKRGRKKRA